MRSPRAAAAVGAAAALPALLLALLVLSSYGPLLRLDDAVSGAAERLDAHRPWVSLLARLATHLGDPAVMTAVALVAVLLLWRARRARLAVVVLLVRVASQVLSTGIKALVDRPRPVFDEPVATAFGPSFPSGHALAAAATWSVLAVVLVALRPAQRLWWLLGAGVPLLVAATRVLIGVHYPSDVVAGLLLGFGTTAVVVLALGVSRAIREPGAVRP